VTDTGGMLTRIAGWLLVPLLMSCGAAAAPVSVAQTGPAKLSDVARLIGDQTGVEVYVDARHEADEIFLTAGTYEMEPLIQAVCFAAGLKSRNVDGLWFLAETEAGLATLVALPPPSERVARREKARSQLVEVLGSLIDSFDFDAAGVPFEAGDFLAIEKRRAGDLRPDQLAFLQREAPQAPLGPATAVRLFPAFQIIVGEFSERPVPPIPDGWLGKYVKSEAEWAASFEGQYIPRGTLIALTLW
jgi:hypothetical protein